MKITKKQLKRIIQEEIENTLSEEGFFKSAGKKIKKFMGYHDHDPEKIKKLHTELENVVEELNKDINPEDEYDFDRAYEILGPSDVLSNNLATINSGENLSPRSLDEIYWALRKIARRLEEYQEKYDEEGTLDKPDLSDLSGPIMWATESVNALKLDLK